MCVFILNFLSFLYTHIFTVFLQFMSSSRFSSRRKVAGSLRYSNTHICTHTQKRIFSFIAIKKRTGAGNNFNNYGKNNLFISSLIHLLWWSELWGLKRGEHDRKGRRVKWVLLKKGFWIKFSICLNQLMNKWLLFDSYCMLI